MSQANRDFLSTEDMSAIIRTLAEVADSNLSLSQKRTRLVRSIAELTDTDAWIWGITGKFKSGEHATFSLSHQEGFSEEQFAAYLAVLEKPKMADMFAPVLTEYADSSTTLTRRRDQFDPEGKIYTDAYAEWKDIGLAPLVVSMTPTSSGGTSCVAIYRHYDKPPYSARDSKIMHLILSELKWLHEEAGSKPPRQTVYSLPPRLNTVLNLLLQGAGRKEIAANLKISPNTLSGYSKEIYRRFNVRSQVELIHRFSVGDRGDESPTHR
ncbi:LuxR C-terminal-related transcriptional regulator [Rubritalea tangerina]|uniref:LuxR C-terminal-related transcriptional regulator n=1 Tax=Rubritalea tangerina TaxID=430798 RepID=A0ABW4ZC13_9BACT